MCAVCRDLADINCYVKVIEGCQQIDRETKSVLCLPVTVVACSLDVVLMSKLVMMSCFDFHFFYSFIICIIFYSI